MIVSWSYRCYIWHAAEVPVKFQSDWKSFNSNLTASRFPDCEMYLSPINSRSKGQKCIALNVFLLLDGTGCSTNRGVTSDLNSNDTRVTSFLCLGWCRYYTLHLCILIIFWRHYTVCLCVQSVFHHWFSRNIHYLVPMLLCGATSMTQTYMS